MNSDPARHPPGSARPPSTDPDDRTSTAGRGCDTARFRVLLCAATLAMILVSAPLWVDLDDFPAVPLFGWFACPGPAWSWACLVAALGGLGLAATGHRGRLGSTVAAAAVGLGVLGDQLRLQAWVYQFLVMSTALAALPGGTGLRYCRIFFISMHFYSGLSKLDVSFLRETGPRFLGAFSQAAGIDLTTALGSWPPSVLLGMPGAEILAAALLSTRTTRRLGLVGVVAIHATLLLILGPGGLGHSFIVLIWNVALIAEGFLLFWARPEPSEEVRRMVLGSFVSIPFGLALILPLAERSGWFDSWPSHALYASHGAQAQIRIKGVGGGTLPEGLRGAFLDPPGVEWRRVDLTAWSRSVRGVPAYPQTRYANGVAEWLGSRLGQPGTVVAIEHRGIADRWTGERALKSLLGLESIRTEGDRFRLNAHPRPTGAHRSSPTW